MVIGLLVYIVVKLHPEIVEDIHTLFLIILSFVLFAGVPIVFFVDLLHFPITNSCDQNVGWLGLLFITNGITSNSNDFIQTFL